MPITTEQKWPAALATITKAKKDGCKVEVAETTERLGSARYIVNCETAKDSGEFQTVAWLRRGIKDEKAAKKELDDRLKAYKPAAAKPEKSLDETDKRLESDTK